jgi:hypothetical protein
MGRASDSRVTAQRRRRGPHFRTYAPPSLRGYVRIPIADVVETGSRKKNLFSALIDRNQKNVSALIFLAPATVHEISLHVKHREAIGADVGTVAWRMRVVSLLANRPPLPTSVTAFGLPTSTTPTGAAAPTPLIHRHKRLPTCGSAGTRTRVAGSGHAADATDSQKQRTSPSAWARLSSLIATLACSGDWNMVPNRPGTCARLKTVSAAT